MLDALPWVISTGLSLVLVVLAVLHGFRSAKRSGRPPAGAGWPEWRRRRRAAQMAADAKLDRIAGAMESANAEQLLAAEVDALNRATMWGEE